MQLAVSLGDYGVVKNPIAGLGVAVVAVKKRDAYTDAALDMLFCSSGYGEASFTKPFHYWLPLMGLLTGARLSELAQLHVADCIERDGHLCLSINVDDDLGQKSVKNSNSIRLVPLHTELVRLGFSEFVRAQRQKGHTKLFPEIPLQAKKTASHAPSKWFARYREKQGVSGPHWDFHSFRVTFITRLLDQNAPQHQVAQLVGHEKGLITSDVYWRPDLGVLARLIELVTLPPKSRDAIAAYAK
jgi:integrase